MQDRPSTHRAGFTLIELLVVIAIIAILAAILFPVFAKAREKARQTTCLNNQRQIAAAILMWVQDHDETFPNKDTWLTELSGSYGVAGKVWDCPTSSFKGTEASPDYFYVGGSFISGMALGDVKDPTAALMIADLANSKGSKPYIDDKDADDGEIAANTVDCRHNNGAVFAFADGHTGWVSSDRVNGLFFIDSVDVKNLDHVAYMGLLSKTPFAFTTADLRTKCVSYGMDIAVGMGIATTQCAIGRAAGDASYTLTAAKEFGMTPAPTMNNAYVAPSWWQLGVGGCTVVGTGSPNLSNTWSRVSGGNYVGELCGGAANSTSTCAFTIVPTLTSDTVKRMALVGNASTAATVTATLVSVQYGTDPVIPINRAVSFTATATNGLNAGVFLMPVKANKKLTINISVTGSATHVGALLVFEN